MTPSNPQALSHAPIHTSRALYRIGCVSFLNALPLIDGIETDQHTVVKYDVPSRLLADLEAGEVDIALCPVIDYHTARTPLCVVPSGAIGCDGTTLTVRLYSQVEPEAINTVHVDTDSHTSIVLMRILLEKLYHTRPRVIDYHAPEHVANHHPLPWPQAMLLIGDKVVSDSPPAVRYPHQMDLGHAWKRMTGLPFVFAVWMTRQNTTLGDLPLRLAKVRDINLQRIDQITRKHADRLGWPVDLARQYLGKNLRYTFGSIEQQAMEHFGTLAHQSGCIDRCRLMNLYTHHQATVDRPRPQLDTIPSPRK